MKTSIAILILLLVLGGIVYVAVLNPLDNFAYNNTNTTRGPTVTQQSKTTSTLSETPSYPLVIHVNGIELEFREEWGFKYASQELNVSDLASIRIFYDPKEDHLEFLIDIKNYSEFYETVKELWNKSAIIYAEPSPGIVVSPYHFIVGPIPLNDVYDHLARYLRKHVGIWMTEAATPVTIQTVSLNRIIESGGTVLHLDLSKYMTSVNDESSFRSITTMPTYKGYDVGVWKVVMNGVERNIRVRIRFTIPSALLLHWVLELHPSDIRYIVPLIWYRDPYFYEVAVPAFKFITDFLKLNYTDKAQLIKNFFGSLNTSDINVANFGDVLVKGGSCREYAFYSMMLARELGIDKVYILAVEPKEETNGWVIGPGIVGHALSVTDDPLIGDTAYNITINEKTFYVFVDNGWAISHWDEFLAMLREGRGFLVQPNPKYDGYPSLTDIDFSRFILGFDNQKPSCGVAPIAVVVNSSTLVLVYDEYGDTTFLEASDIRSTLPNSSYMERFNTSIPLYNVSSLYTDMFRSELEQVVKNDGVVKVYNQSNSYSIIAWYKCPKTVHEVNQKLCTNETCKVYKYMVCVCNICSLTNTTKLCSPEPCQPEWRIHAFYEKLKYPNGFYEEIVIHYTKQVALYRIVVSIPLIFQRIDIS